MNKKQITGISIAVALIAIYFGIKMYASSVAEGKVNESIAKVTNFADIDYKSVSVDLLGMDVRISDILVSPVNAKEKLKIHEIIIHDIDKNADIPTFLSMSCNGIELNIKDLGEEAEGLRNLGYIDKMIVNLNVEYSYDKEKKEINISKIGIGADEAGEISVSLRLGNISLNPNEIVGLLFNFQQIIFHEAKIEYKDESLFERFIKLRAEEQDLSIEDFKKSIIQDIEIEIENANDDLAKDSLGEIMEFVEDPEELSITASPSKPQPLGRLMRIEQLSNDIFRLLNIKIKS